MVNLRVKDIGHDGFGYPALDPGEYGHRGAKDV